ncbi:helix-turn-helix domain-containing protein [Salisaeta longa]|uniref:helix-turn-helix domain-containing protein n=1 Tax=Salisaeta longa TaxID=503170 RepID=UPI0003B4C8F6|nr:helix-turn-helix domain-containing protein [Salisaeta longa]
MEALASAAPAPGSLQTLVENRTSFGGRDIQFSVYDTYAAAQRVALRAAHPLYCGMVTGKKVVHLPDADAAPFDFLPGESLVVPPMETIYIDFPEADETPTKCLTLEIDTDKVRRLVDRMNEQMPRPPEARDWSADELSYCHFQNSNGIERVLLSLLSLFTDDEAGPHRDTLIDLNAAELVIRMLQTKSRALLLCNPSEHAPRHGLAAAIQYARDHLDASLTVDELAAKACMSTSSFYRYFRNELGMTPVQFLTRERMRRARELLRTTDRSVTDISDAVGFSSLSHFISTFKEHVGTTPKQFQLQSTSTPTA